jgi:hypothetical protein
MNIQHPFKAVMANRQTIGPGAAATSVVAALAGITVGLFNIGDCVRFQTAPGQCSAVVRENSGQIFFAGLTLLAAWGGYNTLNTSLRASKGPETTQQ